MTTPSKKAKVDPLKEPDVQRFLSSDAFTKFIKYLENDHPVKMILAPVATMEQRAIHQLRCQEYESILNNLRALNIREKQSRLESDYATPPKPGE